MAKYSLMNAVKKVLDVKLYVGPIGVELTSLVPTPQNEAEIPFWVVHQSSSFPPKKAKYVLHFLSNRLVMGTGPA